MKLLHCRRDLLVFARGMKAANSRASRRARNLRPRQNHRTDKAITDPHTLIMDLPRGATPTLQSLRTRSAVTSLYPTWKASDAPAAPGCWPRPVLRAGLAVLWSTAPLFAPPLRYQKPTFPTPNESARKSPTRRFRHPGICMQHARARGSATHSGNSADAKKRRR